MCIIPEKITYFVSKIRKDHGKNSYERSVDKSVDDSSICWVKSQKLTCDDPENHNHMRLCLRFLPQIDSLT